MVIPLGPAVSLARGVQKITAPLTSYPFLIKGEAQRAAFCSICSRGAFSQTSLVIQT